MKKISIKTIAVLALLTALQIVLSRFLSISTPHLKYDFSFIIVAIAAAQFGAAGGAIVAGLGDLVGALAFPIGPYFPGFTITAALMGAVYGIAFRRSRGLKPILFSVLINRFVLGLLFDTLWITLLYGAPYFGLLPWRLLQSAIMSVISVPVLSVVFRYINRIKWN